MHAGSGEREGGGSFTYAELLEKQAEHLLCCLGAVDAYVGDGTVGWREH